MFILINSKWERFKFTFFTFNFSEYFVKKGVSIIEWASLIKDELPDERLEINIKIIDEEKRLFIIKPIGKIYEDLCEAVL